MTTKNAVVDDVCCTNKCITYIIRQTIIIINTANYYISNPVYSMCNFVLKHANAIMTKCLFIIHNRKYRWIVLNGSKFSIFLAS